MPTGTYTYSGYLYIPSEPQLGGLPPSQYGNFDNAYAGESEDLFLFGGPPVGTAPGRAPYADPDTNLLGNERLVPFGVTPGELFQFRITFDSEAVPPVSGFQPVITLFSDPNTYGQFRQGVFNLDGTFMGGGWDSVVGNIFHEGAVMGLEIPEGMSSCFLSIGTLYHNGDWVGGWHYVLEFGAQSGCRYYCK